MIPNPSKLYNILDSLTESQIQIVSVVTGLNNKIANLDNRDLEDYVKVNPNTNKIDPVWLPSYVDDVVEGYRMTENQRWS
jgi:hypothetical protein